MELALGLPPHAQGDPPVSQFQSLFLWNLPSDLPDQDICQGLRIVSILVFVELALGHAAVGVPSVEDICFNPCFCGTCPRTRIWNLQDIIRNVSILVFVELALGQLCFDPIG